ncbi:CobW/HypB/UreG, nucleotide-binding domain-containing protein [Scenedesmus sp. NREL 46B-D3]|nr:CobW/HypB/UreG, nucleotide-binding domain-containing protein [Scenedesmus sp. NREL 46B-D3]
MNIASDDEELPLAVSLDAGYLGAGKTTLVRYILNERHGFRIAVILNEYGGETGLESAFVQDEQGDRADVPQWVELANGCLCCSVKAEFVQALEGLLGAGSAHAGKFDYVLVETTGLANPGPIMSELWTDEELEAAVVLDGVVAVVDGRNVARQLAEPRPGGAANEAQLQVALADVILLNKMDLLTEPQAEAVTAQLRAINSAATVVPTSHSRVDLGCLLNRGAYYVRLLEQLQAPTSPPPAAAAAAGGNAGAAEPEGAGSSTAQVPPAVQQPLQWLAEVSAAAAAAAASSCTTPGCSNHEHQHQHVHHTGTAGDQAAQAQAGLTPSGPCQAHDAAVRTIALRVAQPLLLERFRSWVEGLIWDHPEAAKDHPAAAAAAAADNTSAAAAADQPAAATSSARAELLRMKGLLNVAGSSRAHMFQAVYDLYDIVPGADWQQLQQHMPASATAAAAAGQGSDAPLTRLVLIGRYLDQQLLQQQLEQCCADGDGTIQQQV